MPSVTLAESAKLSQNDLVAGVIEEIITVNRMFSLLPFDGIEGNALQYTRENVLAPVATFGVGDSLGAGGATAEQQAAKDPATFTTVTSGLTTIMGDAEVNGLIQATRSNITDQTTTQIASKAKSCGRRYQTMLVTGDTGALATDFDGLQVLCDVTQTVVQDDGGGITTNGGTLTLEAMDEGLDLVTDKDGQVDYITAHARTLRRFRQVLRAQNGSTSTEAITLPDGTRSNAGYNEVPIFRNDYIPINETQGSLTTGSSMYFGTLDDGSRKHGIAGLTAADMAGIHVVPVGESETADETITRVKWYCGLALFSLRGLSRLRGIA